MTSPSRLCRLALTTSGCLRLRKGATDGGHAEPGAKLPVSFSKSTSFPCDNHARQHEQQENRSCKNDVPRHFNLDIREVAPGH